jgi:hypothetical protein
MLIIGYRFQSAENTSVIWDVFSVLNPLRALQFAVLNHGIRAEQASNRDVEGIRQVNLVAFGREHEAKLVDHWDTPPLLSWGIQSTTHSSALLRPKQKDWSVSVRYLRRRLWCWS